MRAHVLFDTLAYANRLKEAGMESKIAEIQAETNAEMIASLFDDRVTKQDLVATDSGLRQEMARIRTELMQEIARVRTELMQEIAQVKVEIAQTRADLEHQITKLRAEFKQDIKDLEIRLTIRLGAIMAAGLAIIMAMIRMA